MKAGLTVVLQLLTGFAMIAALLAIHALVLYAIWWLVMIVVSYVPIVGKKYRHRDWERLNRESNVPPKSRRFASKDSERANSI